MADDSPQLEYAPSAPFIRRRNARRLAFLILVAAAAIAIFLYRHHIQFYYHQAKLLRLQRQCLAYSPPPDRVVYEEDPAAVARLLQQSDYFAATVSGRTVALWHPEIFDRLWNAGYPSKPPKVGVLFIHEWLTPEGKRVLIAATVEPLAAGHLSFDIHKFHLATWKTPISSPFGKSDWNSTVGDGAKPLRLYAGQVDAAPPAEITAKYELGGKAAGAIAVSRGSGDPADSPAGADYGIALREAAR